MAALNSVGNVFVSSISGINLANLKVKNLATCTVDSDLANKLYVDSRLNIITNIGSGAPLLKGAGAISVQTSSIIYARTLVGNGFTVASDNTQVYINYDLYDASFPQNTINTTSLALPNLDRKWSGGALAKDGKIYSAPDLYTSVLVYDTYTGSGGSVLDTTSLSLAVGGYGGTILAPNGKLYSIPSDSTNVLIIDPVNKVLDTTTLTGLPSVNSKWIGGCLAPNGKIYCVPYTASSVLIIDPVNNVLDTTTISGISGTNKWRGGVLGTNGNIYCAPADITTMLIINPNTNSINTSSIAGFSSNTQKWDAGCLAPNTGNLYFAPDTETRVLIINTSGNVPNTTSVVANFRGSKWCGATVGSNGNIYLAPKYNTQILMINTVSNTTSTISVGTIPGTISGAFKGGVLAPNGNVYMIPNGITYVAIVKTGILTTQLLQSFSAYYNKY